jgi:dipeptidyl aminopeptidase/acylaminoacyl peptidase
MHYRAARVALFIASLSTVVPFSCSIARGAPPDRPNREELYRRYLRIGALIRGGMVAPHWLADGNRFWFVAGGPINPSIYLVDPLAKTKETIFQGDRARAALARRLGHESKAFFDLAQLKLEAGEAKVRFALENKSWLFDRKDSSVKEAQPEAKAAAGPRLIQRGFMFGEPPVVEVASADNKHFAGQRAQNLYVRSGTDDRILPLTNDGVKENGYTVAGAQWSPDGSMVAAMRVDARRQPVFRVVRYLAPVPEVITHDTTQPGGPLPRLSLYAFDVRTKKQLLLDAAPLDTDRYLYLIRWLPDSSEFLYGRADRELKKLELLAANPKTQKTRVVLTETQPTFVDVPLLSSFDVPVLAGGKKFLWLSERSGFNHIYLYDVAGKLIKQLTTGDDPVVHIVDVDEAGGWVYYTAHGERERPYDTHLYRVRLDGSGMARLTEAPGQHDFPAYLAALEGSPASVQLSPSKKFFIDTHSSPEQPTAAELRTTDGQEMMKLAQADVSRLSSLNWHAPEEFVAKSADGKTDLYGLIYKPADFDPAKKYPVIDNIYNGPQTTWVPRTFNGPQAVFPQALAQLGFIVFIVDGRGTPERGKAFQDVVYGNFGRYEVPDHVAVLRQLGKSRPYMDLSRVGVMGGSFGGYMTVRAMLMAPEVYRVGVATAPVNSVEELQAGMERYLGTPQHHPQAYEFASNFRLAPRLRGKLFLIHGNLDANAPFGSTLKLVAAFIEAGRAVDMLVLPDQTHAFGGKARMYWMDSVGAYFVKNLLSLPPGP